MAPVSYFSREDYLQIILNHFIINLLSMILGAHVLAAATVASQAAGAPTVYLAAYNTGDRFKRAKCRTTMTGTIDGTIVAVIGLLVLALPARAHHVASAEFDPQKQVSVQGKITKIEWNNPHVYIWLDVKNPAGKTEAWSFETTTPRALRTAGINREDFAIGQSITMRGILAKDHARKFAWLRQAAFQDGRTVTTWPATANSNFTDYAP